MIAYEIVFVNQIFSENHRESVNGRILRVWFLGPRSHIPFLEVLIFILVRCWSVVVRVVS
jgi:hypothetical protein